MPLNLNAAYRGEMAPPSTDNSSPSRSRNRSRSRSRGRDMPRELWKWACPSSCSCSVPHGSSRCAEKPGVTASVDGVHPVNFRKKLKGELPGLEDASFRIVRQSVFTGRWTVYVSGGGAAKPKQYSTTRAEPRVERQPIHSENCPFCRGNEHKVVSPLVVVTSEGEVFEPPHLPDHYLVRVVPNIFPVLLTPAGSYGDNYQAELLNLPHLSAARGKHRNELTMPVPFESMSQEDRETNAQLDAVGYSEVVIENQQHNALLAIVGAEMVFPSLRALQERGKTLISKPGIRQLCFIKQYGGLSGGSLLHPHMQIYAFQMITPEMSNLRGRAIDYYKKHCRCSCCQSLVNEPTQRGSLASSRLILETQHFVVSVPFASREYRICICPKRHCPTFLEATREELQDLAHVLQLVMEAVYHGLDDPPYNLHIPSMDDQALRMDATSCAANHWLLEVHPRFPADFGGLELATGLRICSGLPEEHAQLLRREVEKILDMRGEGEQARVTIAPELESLVADKKGEMAGCGDVQDQPKNSP